MDAYKNFAYGNVLTAPSPATSGTTLVLGAGQGAAFPPAPFNATVWPNGAMPTVANAEIVRVTALATDTASLTRAQEGSTARAISAGDQIAATITGAMIDSLRNASELNAGTLLEARLSANVARRDQANTLNGLLTVLAGIVSDAGPNGWINLRAGTAPTDARVWQVLSSGGSLFLRALNDASTVENGSLVLAQGGHATLTGTIKERGRTVPMGEWNTYPVTWTCQQGATNPTLGNGSLIATYTVIGKTVLYRIGLNIGSTTTGGSGMWLFGLPVPNGGQVTILARCVYYTNTGQYYDLAGMAGLWFAYGGENKVGFLAGSPTNTTLSATAPVAMSNGAVLNIEGQYEMA